MIAMMNTPRRKWNVSAPDEKTERLVWESLSRAGLIEIGPNEFPDRIRDMKNLVISRLNELLEQKSAMKERESAAYSLGTLKKLETTLQQHPPKSGRSRS